MKLTNLCLLFVVLELSFIIIMNSRMDHVVKVSLKSMDYNKALDSSVDDGTVDLVELDSNRNITLNKEKAVEHFFVSLYANFGGTWEERLQRKLREHVPIILVTDWDGFYIYYMDAYDESGEILIESKWSEKYPYTYEEDNLVYKFTFGDFITIYDKDSNEVKNGEYKDLGLEYANSIMADENIFHIVRRDAIIKELEKWMNYYINQYNDIAYQFGITYQFWLPKIDKTDWYRTIDDISLFVIFQNYPYYAGSLDTYNRYAFGGARITKSNQYHIKKIEGITYYHRNTCSYIDEAEEGITYYTKEESASSGAFPCPSCKP